LQTLRRIQQTRYARRRNKFPALMFLRSGSVAVVHAVEDKLSGRRQPFPGGKRLGRRKRRRKSYAPSEVAVSIRLCRKDSATRGIGVPTSRHSRHRGRSAQVLPIQLGGDGHCVASLHRLLH
jgi:hypothetical protein